jgi:hypothetical protein
MPYKSYTRCVKRDEYENPDFSVQALLAAFGVLLGNPIAVSFSLISGVEKLLDYMLNKKLVCLGGDRCALGRIVEFETVEEKAFPDNVDNDLSMNLMLYPGVLGDFVGKSNEEGWQTARQEVQGILLDEQPGMPLPNEPSGGKRYDPYVANVDVVDAYTIGGFNTMIPLQGNVSVPVLHVECEGSRIHDLLAALQTIGSWGFGKEFCEIPIIGWIACAAAKVLLAPIIVGALVAAWSGADDGNPADARLDPEAGALALGDLIVVTGRWVYDAGHSGWNELHPVKTIQKVDPASVQPYGAAALVQRWCAEVSLAPPPDRSGPNGAPQSMTAGQATTWDAQRQHTNRWHIHPLIDGCRPQPKAGDGGPVVVK